LHFLYSYKRKKYEHKLYFGEYLGRISVKIGDDFMSGQDALFERLAREPNITVEEMKEIISARILKGWNYPNPIRQGQWRKISSGGCVKIVIRNPMNGSKNMEKIFSATWRQGLYCADFLF
jgi:hypothetical protein